MRGWIALSLVSSFSLVGLACSSGDDLYSPSEPAEFDSTLFQKPALAKFADLDDRAYVMGHATGVYLLGKTLPSYVYPKGYLYRPGHSSEKAAVQYNWEEVMRARSGGSDGSGHVLYLGEGDDVCPSEEDQNMNGICDDNETPTTPTTPDCDPNDDINYCPPGGGGGGGGGGDGGGDPGGGGGGGGDGGGDPGGGGGGGGGGGPIDPDCEEFLDPAAVQARELGKKVDVERMLGAEFAGDNHARYVNQFEKGMKQALAVQDFGENVAHSEVEATKESSRDYGLCDHSPLVLDLDGDGVRLSSVDEGVRFDILEHGHTMRTAWPTGGDALLVRDLDGDGRITSGAELFGQSLLPEGGRQRDGFAALAQLDSNADGRIDATDPAFATLRLWIDADHDGVTDAGELVTLETAHVTALSLGYTRSDDKDLFGNSLRLQGSFEREEDGMCTKGSMIDAWFKLAR